MTKATRVTRGPCGRRRPFPACLAADEYAPVVWRKSISYLSPIGSLQLLYTNKIDRRKKAEELTFAFDICSLPILQYR
jgi:hypothetical protein